MRVFEDGVYKEGGCLWEKVSDAPFVRWCANAFNHYQNGFLYFDGGVGDQLAWYLDVIAIMSSNKNKLEKEENEREAKERERKSRRGR